MITQKNEQLINLVQKYIYPVTGVATDFDPLLKYIGDAPLVLLGEATHGTHEFYNIRAEITKRLITEKDFNFIAIEGDWPDAYQVHRYIHARTQHEKAAAAVAEFKRFPAWMWRNQEIVALIDWLHSHNNSANVPVGFYGLDLYSLHRSMEVVIDELTNIDPQAAQRARERYNCFDAFTDPQQYGYFAMLYPSESCRSAVIAQLVELHKQDRKTSSEEVMFSVAQNARVVKNAEHYYRSMFEGNPAHSWNIRDTHMMETLESLMQRRIDGKPSKGIVWAHNSHLGDARATQMATAGELNLGQLVRERYAQQAVLVGFTTYTGTVSAASTWGGNVERKYVLPARDDSYEALFHDVTQSDFILFPNTHPQLAAILNKERLERAIGVIYAPRTERESHYFYAKIAEQFDAIIHIDTTHAVEPLDKTEKWDRGELPDTYPFGV